MHFYKSNVRAVSLIIWAQGVTLIYTERLHHVMLHWGTFHHGLQDCTMLCMSNILGKLMTHGEMGKMIAKLTLTIDNSKQQYWVS